MKTIWKYEITTNRFSHEMPVGARVLSVQVQRVNPQMWVKVDPGAATELRHFQFFGTGHPIEQENVDFIGTFQTQDGDFVWHLFEIIE